jgi:site-specific recombinase XerD
VVTAAGKQLSTRAIHRIITEGLLLARVKKPSIVVHSLRHSTPTFALFNDANATTEIYVEKVQRLLERAEEAVTQIKGSLDDPKICAEPRFCRHLFQP